jgi:hypothetical protein
VKTGTTHRARKALFQRGIKRGYLTVSEIDEALPHGALTPAERWLLYYSLRASDVEIRDDTGRGDDLPPVAPNGH